MKKIKKLLSVVFVLCAIAVFSMTASAASGAQDNGKVKWTLENGVLTVYGKGAMEDYAPAGAESGWFEKYLLRYRSDVYNIVVSKNVTRIGESGFAYARNSMSAKIADSVTEISDWAFLQNESMTAVYIPSSVKKIGRMAFYECDNLKDVYYAGTKAQWKKISIGSNNEDLRNATIHYNVDGIDTPVEKKDQTIKGTASYTKTVGNASFQLKASAKTALTYASDNKSVATVSKTGKVTIKGAGEATITIKAAASKKFNAAKKTVKITVNPAAAKIQNVVRKNDTTAVIKWKKVKKIDGYELQICTGKDFTDPQVLTAAASKKKLTVKILEKGQKYFVRIRTYKVTDGKTYYSKWSAAKTIKK